MSLVDYVKEDFGISGSGRWLRSDVHSSLVVDSENELFYFNSRGISGNTLDYLIKVRGVEPKVARDMVHHRTAGMPVDSAGQSIQVKFDKLVDLFHSSGRNERDYWYARGLTDKTIDRYRLGNFDGWNLIPIYDAGLFINFQCRKDKPEKRMKFWYRDKDFKPVLYNMNILPYVDSIYITEGMVDCLLLNQLGLPSVCSTNGALSWSSNWIRHFTKIDNIVYIADNDSAGVRGAKMVANYLGLYKVKILRFKEEREKYGALNYFVDSGGTVSGFKDIINERAVYGFQESEI